MISLKPASDDFWNVHNQLIWKQILFVEQCFELFKWTSQEKYDSFWNLAWYNFRPKVGRASAVTADTGDGVRVSAEDDFPACTVDVLEHEEPPAQPRQHDAGYRLARMRLIRDEEWALETQRQIRWFQCRTDSFWVLPRGSSTFFCQSPFLSHYHFPANFFEFYLAFPVELKSSMRICDYSW